MIPEGVTSVKPRVLSGWIITPLYRPLNPPVTLYGKKINQTVDSISWTGGNVPDNQFEDFSISMRLPAAANGTILYFSVYQSCGKNQSIAWDQRPGPTGEEPSVPAASLTLIAELRNAASVQKSGSVGMKSASLFLAFVSAVLFSV
jgi:uncharacterized protein YcnI